MLHIYKQRYGKYLCVMYFGFDKYVVFFLLLYSPQQHYQLIPTAYTKFLKDISDMCFDGIDRKEYLITYMFVGLSLPYQKQNLKFHLGEFDIKLVFNHRFI